MPPRHGYVLLPDLSLYQFQRQFRHGTLLCADIGTDVNGNLMSLLNGLSGEQRGRESTGKGVAGSDGVGNLNLRRRLETSETVLSKDIAAVSSACQHHHLKMVSAHDDTAFFLYVETGVIEHAANGNELLIVDLKDIGMSDALPEHLLVVEVAAEVDVENLQTVLRRRLKDLIDCLA